MKSFIYGLFVIGFMSVVVAQDNPTPAVVQAGAPGMIRPPIRTAKEMDDATVQTPEIFHRVEVITLAVPKTVISKWLAEDRYVTAEGLLTLLRGGEAELLETQTVNTGSRTEGTAENLVMHYLYKGVRYSGSPTGGQEIPDYQQREVGSRLRARIAAEPNNSLPPSPGFVAAITSYASLDIKAEYISQVEIGPTPPKENTPAQSFPSIFTVSFKGNARLSASNYTLLSGGCQSPDKKTLVFLLARLGAEPPAVPPPGLIKPPGMR